MACAKIRNISSHGGCGNVARSPTATYSVMAKPVSQRVSLSAVRMVRRPPLLEVRRKTPSRRATPSIQPRAMTKVTARLMTSDCSARR